MAMISAVIIHNCVARIGAALKTDNNICLLAEHIGDFPFALVSPICSYNRLYHLICLLSTFQIPITYTTTCINISKINIIYILHK